MCEEEQVPSEEIASSQGGEGRRGEASSERGRRWRVEAPSSSEIRVRRACRRDRKRVSEQPRLGYTARDGVSQHVLPDAYPPEVEPSLCQALRPVLRPGTREAAASGVGARALGTTGDPSRELEHFVLPRSSRARADLCSLSRPGGLLARGPCSPAGSFQTCSYPHRLIDECCLPSSTTSATHRSHLTRTQYLSPNAPNGFSSNLSTISPTMPRPTTRKRHFHPIPKTLTMTPHTQSQTAKHQVPTEKKRGDKRHTRISMGF